MAYSTEDWSSLDAGPLQDPIYTPTAVDAGPVTDTDADIIEGNPPTEDPTPPDLFYPQLDPNAPENRLRQISPFTKLVYANLPTFIKEADEHQNEESGGWPLLKLIDAPCHIPDKVRAVTDELARGVWTNPATVPDRGLRWLASILGVPQSQKAVPAAQLREALTNVVANGRPPTGTRAEIAASARQFLTGTKQVLVTSGIRRAEQPLPEDLALLTAMGITDPNKRVWVSPAAPAPAKPSAGDVWVNERTQTVATYTDGKWAPYTTSNVAAAATAAVTARAADRFRRAHTIVIIARPDEVPGNDLGALAEQIRAAGLVPAGHTLEVVIAAATWQGFEDAVTAAGGTWADYERETRTWADDESLGLSTLGDS